MDPRGKVEAYVLEVVSEGKILLGYCIELLYRMFVPCDIVCHSTA